MPKPQNIVIIRHGESIGNVYRTIYSSVPDYAVELTANGKEQAFNAGKEIALACPGDAAFYVSPYWRTRQTYLELKKSIPEAKFYEDPRLREQEWGTNLSEFRQDFENERDTYGHFFWRFPSGESCGDVFDRISDFLNTLHRDFEKETYPENAIIVCHGMTLRVFMMRFFHMTVEEFEILRNPRNAQFHILTLQENGKYKLMTELEKYPEYKHPYQFNWNQ